MIVHQGWPRLPVIIFEELKTIWAYRTTTTRIQEVEMEGGGGGGGYSPIEATLCRFLLPQSVGSFKFSLKRGYKFCHFGRK